MKEMITYLEPQIAGYIVWAHVRGNINANNLDQQLSGKHQIRERGIPISHHNLDTVQQPLLPTMRRRGHNPVSFAADGWVERLVGHRKFFEKLVAEGQVAAPPPILAVSSDKEMRTRPLLSLPHQLGRNICGCQSSISGIRGRGR